ncbi:probable carboxylesterase 17 [Aristolochia californica]|uniref:probable carboxylesterase 17 n=1 Tax=Aristolochia californica TaxID=171875 RepID=UPI0035E190AF
MVFTKKVVDEVSGWLRVYDDGSVDRTWTGPPDVKFLAEPFPPSEEFIDGVATRDVVIDAKSGLSLRIYLPEGKADEEPKLPVLLHFHGGGFCISQADWVMYYAFYSRLVRTARAVCVSVFLRRAPEHRLPAACDDSYAALCWLRSIARGDVSETWLQARADLSRVFLIGDSSGGNIVHHVAARVVSEEFSPLTVAGAIPIHGGFVRAERSKSELQLEYESPFLTLAMLDKFLALALPIGSTKDHLITCPMGPQAPPLEGQDLPPFLVPIAQQDLIYDGEMEYVEAMKKAGKEVQVLYSPGLGHCFYLNKIAVDSDPHTAAQTELLIAGISEFIRKH